MEERTNTMATISSTVSDFADQVRRDVQESARVLRESGTLSASNIGNAYQRVPGEDKIVLAKFPGLWESEREVKLTVIGFDGTVISGDTQAGGAQYSKLFHAHPEITTIVHAHTPYLASWSSAQQSFRILYVAAQRHTLAREIPVHIDRRTSQIDFILEHLSANRHTFAILEGNGGSTYWGDGVIKTAQTIILVEEAAKFQHLAQAIGGSKEYGPGVLEQQWKLTGLNAKAA
jgi:L-ribulose-5-phosphate 4-epimerase